jgi:hypothetical protein
MKNTDRHFAIHFNWLKWNYLSASPILEEIKRKTNIVLEELHLLGYNVCNLVKLTDVLEQHIASFYRVKE